jgi:hypothetical protein
MADPTMELSTSFAACIRSLLVLPLVVGVVAAAAADGGWSCSVDMVGGWGEWLLLTIRARGQGEWCRRLLEVLPRRVLTRDGARQAVVVLLRLEATDEVEAAG